ncbi:MAG: tetratricopeptide repeat protein [Acidobacteria bacterium]|nr:tetratricopeptide repeat protein [Acidobacteriota bacterium]
MNRENFLFAAVGLLLGYIVAFHLVVYVNQNHAAPAAGVAGASAAEGLPADHPSVSGEGGAERRQLLADAERAAGEARKTPDDFDAQVKAGEGYFRAGSFEDAIDFMTRANKLRPDDYSTVVRLGNFYSSAGRFEDAARWYTAALAKRPEDCDARSELALTFFLRKPSQPERAVGELRRCLDKDPNHVPSLHNLALMLMETKQYAESEATLARLEKLDPTYEDLPRLRERLRAARAGAQQKSPTD